MNQLATWPEITSTHLIVVGIYVLVAMSLSFNIQRWLNRRKLQRISRIKNDGWTIYMHEQFNTNEILIVKMNDLQQEVVRGKISKRVKGKLDLNAFEYSQSVLVPEKELKTIRKEITKAFEALIKGPRPEEPTQSNIYIIKK